MSYVFGQYQNSYLRVSMKLMNTTDNVALSTDTGYGNW